MGGFSKMDGIDSFILIGGRSSRLGTDKAFVELGGMTLAERAIANARLGLSPERITMVAGSSMQFAIDARTSGIPFVFDIHEARGPLGGIHAALAHAQTPWIFVLACDYPLVSAELIRFLAGRVSDEVDVVLPEQQDGRMQSLCAFYKVDIATPIVDEIVRLPRSPPPMHEIVAQMNLRIVKFDEYSHLDGADIFFLNINTAEDLASARLRV